MHVILSGIYVYKKSYYFEVIKYQVLHSFSLAANHEIALN